MDFDESSASPSWNLKRLLEREVDNNELFDISYSGDQTFFGSVQILLNTAIGSGTLMIPYCYTSGILNALIVSTIFGLISLATLWFMIQTAHKCHSYGISDLFSSAFSSKYAWIVHVIIIIVLFGVCSIYLYFGGHLLRIVLNIQKSPFDKDGFWIWVISVFFVFPIMCLKSLKKLESFALLSTLSIIILISHSVFWFIKESIKKEIHISSQIKYFAFNKAFLSCFSINAVAYHCHVNLFACLDHLKDCTIPRARGLVSWTMGISFLLYQILGIFSYLSLFDKIGNKSILDYYDQNNWFTKISTFCVVIIMIISTPLLAHSLRNALNQLIWNTESTNTRWVLMGAGIIGLGALAVSLYGQIITYFDLIGGFFLPFIVFIFPSLFFIRICKSAPLYQKIIAIFIILVGFMVMVVCSYKTISDL